MTKKKIGAALLAASLAVLPLFGAQKAGADTLGADRTMGTYNGVAVHYTVGLTSGGGTTPASGCSGPAIVVFGSSALKNFVTQAAVDYCNTFADKTTAPDVEYATSPAGDSCPGVDYAADNSDNNEIGASDVFAPACTSTQARSASKIKDTNAGPNIVESIAQCPGANEVQGGSPVTPTTPAPCQGNGTGSLHFAAPNDESVQAAQLLWNNALGDYAQINGTSGVAPYPQNRVKGSGTRATWCSNIYGAGADRCVGPGTDADTTGTEIKDVCGNQTTGAAPLDPAGAIGYVTRSAVVAPTAGSNVGLIGCGLVNLAGHNGYNGPCNPTAPSSPDGINPESLALTCSGDLEVATGVYPTWGYEHFDLNAASTANAAAQAFINFATSTEDPVFQQKGFMRNCQMLFQRGVDGGPYAATAGASC